MPSTLSAPGNITESQASSDWGRPALSPWRAACPFPSQTRVGLSRATGNASSQASSLHAPLSLLVPCGLDNSQRTPLSDRSETPPAQCQHRTEMPQLIRGRRAIFAPPTLSTHLLLPPKNPQLRPSPTSPTTWPYPRLFLIQDLVQKPSKCCL